MIPHRIFKTHRSICSFAHCKAAPCRRYEPRSLLPVLRPRCNATPDLPLTDKTPSQPRAALWMAGWLTLMLIVAVAGREATRELNVFQIMEVRSIAGFLMLYPLIHINRGLAAMKT